MLTWNLAHDIGTDVDVGVDVEVASVHGAHALEFFVLARVQVLLEGRVAVDEQLHLSVDIAGDVGYTFDGEA